MRRGAQVRGEKNEEGWGCVVRGTTQSRGIELRGRSYAAAPVSSVTLSGQELSVRLVCCHWRHGRAPPRYLGPIYPNH